MAPESSIFSLPRDLPLPALAPDLERGGRRLAVDAPARGVRVWLDTFDWRLFRADRTLELLEVGASRSLRLRAGADAALETPVGDPPRFASDLPPGVLRRRLGTLADVRALLPRARRAGAVERARVLDSRGKTVVRLELWRPPRRGNGELLVHAVRGFERAAAAVCRRLGVRRDIERCARDPLLDMARELPVPPGEYPSWKLAGLEADMRTDDALRRLLAHYADIMALNVDGMRDDVDPEFLHDFRVGVRRSRALLRRVPGVFAPGRIAPFTEHLAWLGATTGPARDADVHALVFPGYAEWLDAADREALEPLMACVARERAEAHGALEAALRSARFRRRSRAWTEFLARPTPRASRQPAAPEPLARTAARAIARAERKVRRQGRALTPESPAEQFHNLRKSCKNLRYLIDAFGKVFHSSLLQKTTRDLKALQDLLGEHQDLDVHRGALERFHGQLAEEGALSGETHGAMERLVARLRERAQTLRHGFRGPFRRFHARRVGKALERS